jgi:hypothetical protein
MDVDERQAFQNELEEGGASLTRLHQSHAQGGAGHGENDPREPGSGPEVEGVPVAFFHGRGSAERVHDVALDDPFGVSRTDQTQGDGAGPEQARELDQAICLPLIEDETEP